MTSYTQIYDELKAAFLPTEDSGFINGSTITIHNVKFKSTIDNDFFSSDNDANIYENSHFFISDFLFPKRIIKEGNIVVSWFERKELDKYLAWAYYLAKKSGSYIVLFPISFHINRSPQAWRDPRSVFKSFNVRKTDKGEIDKLSLANVVLSSRLSETPLRFFSSGYQTVRDVCKLVDRFRMEPIPLLPKTGMWNFSYSNRSVYVEIILMANPGGLLTIRGFSCFAGVQCFHI